MKREVGRDAIIGVRCTGHTSGVQRPKIAVVIEGKSKGRNVTLKACYERHGSTCCCWPGRNDSKVNTNNLERLAIRMNKSC